MSHVTGSEPEDHRADLDWLYRQDKPASGYAGRATDSAAAAADDAGLTTCHA